MKFLFISRDGFTSLHYFKSLYDAIIDYANETGECSELFVHAIKGCENEPEIMINMYNFFATVPIVQVFVVSETIYDEVS